uniref:DUF2189 domain-containing protein n=1 Tax=uncultured Thiotrichaceae bacterium TaxID=298394 RepID=A0A6S6U9T3_9GAMM|nr:MAG: Unknown protein [uncultured Thiotrichaceae bacterium]
MAAISDSDRDLLPDNKGERTEALQFEIREVDADAPMRWLEKGISDYKEMIVPSTVMGLVYVIAGMIMMSVAWSYPVFMTTLAAGFLIIGPLVAVGFYNMSMELEKGNKPDMLTGTMMGWAFMARNALGLCCFAMVLGVLMGVWALVSSVTVALFFDNLIVGRDFLDTLAKQHNVVPFILTYMLTGLVIAAIAFSISVVAAPLVTHRRVDFVTAMITSVEAVKINPAPMFTWALMIVALVVVGFLLGFIGLAVTLPIVGHASWHAYRDLVAESQV